MPVRDPGAVSQYKDCVIPAEVAACAARWKPAAGTPAEAGAFARQVVAGCGPLPAQDRAKNLLWAAVRLAAWGTCAGLEPVPGALLHPSVIERFTAHSPGLSPAARRTLRTNLRFIARRVVPHLDPADRPLPRGRAKAPYSAAEIAGYLALADAQPTAGRRSRATALVCLGAGAGLIRSDLRNVRGTDIVRRSGGVIVDVRGRAPRAVPVLARYHAPLLQAAAFTGQDFLTGGTEPERGNITNPLTRSLAGGGGLPPLDTSRLRATWLAEAAALIGLPAFMLAAGISCCQRLGDITAGLDPGTEEHAVALLGGQAR
jgi:integrase